VKYPEGQKEETRKKIVKTASRMFRERGVRGTTVPKVMSEAGYTVGGFYKHFESKDALFREALDTAIAGTSKMLELVPPDVRGEAFPRMAAEAYLTMAHRENVSKGCALAALSGDVARSDKETRAAFEDALCRTIEAIANRLDGEDRESRAWSFMSSIMGALILSRAVSSEETAARILDSCVRDLISTPEERT